jgi:FAD-dependent halogenase
MDSSVPEEFDVVVVGGGPAGSSLAAFVAMQGHRVLLLEKERFPRYQIGESLLPSTVHGICRLLGVTKELEAARFTPKLGGTFRWGASPDPWTFFFSISPQLSGSTSFAYQVERMKFDQILLDNARRVGVDVREETSVVDVLEDTERVHGVSFRDAEDKQRSATARYVVDASGNRSRIYKQVGGTRHYSDFFRNVALFGYFEGGKRLATPLSGNILSAAFDDGWFWYIPLTPDLTSVGAVVNQAAAAKVQGGEAALMELIDRCPIIRDMLEPAQRVTEGPYGEIRVRKDYSYCHSQFWKPGMVLVGDAACFVDPVFSSGVHLATYSALLAARSINSCLDGTLEEKAAFGEFEARYRREYGLFYEFLTAFYDMHVDEQSYFWKARKVTRAKGTEYEAFVELVGGIGSGEGLSFDQGTSSGARVRSSIASTSRHMSRSVQDAAEGSGNPPVSFFGTPVVDDVMQEGAQIQAQAVLGADMIPADPLLPHGLAPSEDGLRWVEPTDPLPEG